MHIYFHAGNLYMFPLVYSLFLLLIFFSSVEKLVSIHGACQELYFLINSEFTVHVMCVTPHKARLDLILSNASRL